MSEEFMNNGMNNNSEQPDGMNSQNNTQEYGTNFILKDGPEQNSMNQNSMDRNIVNQGSSEQNQSSPEHNNSEQNNSEQYNSEDNNEASQSNLEKTGSETEDPLQTSSTYRFWAEQITAPKEYYNNPYNKEEKEDRSEENKDGAEDKNEGNPLNTDNVQHVFNMSPDNSQPDKKNRKKGRGLKKAVNLLLKAAVVGIIAGITFIGVNWAYYKINPNAPLYNIGNNFSISGNKLNLNPTAENQIPTTSISKETIEQNSDISGIVESAMPSIVTINSTFTQKYDWFGQQYNEENQGSGSGIIVGKNDKELLIATNNHVVDQATSITVTFINNVQAKAVIKGTDAVADLAVISIDLTTIKSDTMNAIKIANLGNSDSVKVGQMAIAIGNALGYGQSVTVGYISAKDREVDVDGSRMVLLQTDAAINPGNSGGALLNLKGEVIGINSVKYASSEVEGMGYAIPITRATPIINELMNRETLTEDEKGYLGVYIKQVTEEDSKMYNWPVGVYVISTIQGGSAETAGIYAGDIITKVNGSEVKAESQLQEKVNSFRAGTEVTLTIMRIQDGKYVEKEIKVTLGSNSTLKTK